MSLWENVLTLVILFGIFVLIYCKMKEITIVQFFKDIIDLFKSEEIGGIKKWIIR